MEDLPLRARLLVAGSVARAGALWAIPPVGVATSPWWTSSLPSPVTIATLAVTAGLAAMVGCVVFPHARYGAWTIRRLGLVTGAASTRTVNLVAELGIATGTGTPHRVVVVPSPVPNVAAVPDQGVVTIVVTSGAEVELPRDELAALLATQYFVASDKWVHLASAAQVVSSTRFAVLIVMSFVNPFLMPLAFLAFFDHRRADTVRDMVADHAALRATRHPDALAAALFHLRPAAPHAHRLRVGLPAFLVAQYWVLSMRQPSTTSVSGPSRSRTWSTTDEVAAEMAMRSDRMTRAARGEPDAMFDLVSWKRAVRGLGTASTSPTGLPLALDDAERARARVIEAALGPKRRH